MRITPFAFGVVTIMPCVIVYFLFLDKFWDSNRSFKEVFRQEELWVGARELEG